jgi:hypothetical protein
VLGAAGSVVIAGDGDGDVAGGAACEQRYRGAVALKSAARSHVVVEPSASATVQPTGGSPRGPGSPGAPWHWVGWAKHGGDLPGSPCSSSGSAQFLAVRRDVGLHSLS